MGVTRNAILSDVVINEKVDNSRTRPDKTIAMWKVAETALVGVLTTMRPI